MRRSPAEKTFLVYSVLRILVILTFVRQIIIHKWEGSVSCLPSTSGSSAKFRSAHHKMQLKITPFHAMRCSLYSSLFVQSHVAHNTPIRIVVLRH